MLKKTLIPLMGLLAIIYAGCNPNGDDKAIGGTSLSTNIEYDVTINNYEMACMNGLEGSNSMWYKNNLEGSVRGAFLDMLFDKALKGILDLYDLDNKQIDTIALKKLLSRSDTITMTRANPPYDEFDTIVTSMIEPCVITALRFREEWTYNPKTMAITKKVLAMAPVMTTVTYDENYNEICGDDKPLFWIKFDKEPSKTIVLTKRIQYFASYGGFEESKAINADSTAIEKYMTILLNKIFSDSITAYDFSGCSLSDEPLSGKEWNERINSVDTLVMKRAEAPYDSYDTIISNVPDISAIRFLEEWYLDTVSMAIQKKVVGVCPVEVCYTPEGELKGYRPCLWVYFDDVWMPFNKKLELKKKKK